MMLSLERFIKACKNETVDRPPVWMMRQAGRTLPEYLELRKKYSFWECCQTPELAAEITLQPLRRFPVDAAIIFSDILVIPAAMGMNVQFTPKLTVTPPLKNASDIHQLDPSHITKKLDYVRATIKEVSKAVGKEKAVLGFSGAPYTLACYMVEGGSSKDFTSIRELMYHNPKLFKELLNKLADCIIEYLLMQLDSGITAAQLFDTWAGELNPEDFKHFILPIINRIFEKTKRKGIPMIYYINGISSYLDMIKESGADIIGIDWRISLSEARSKLGKNTVVQGNLDPALLFAPKEEIYKRVNDMINMTEGKGHIVNLGHGLIPETPIEGIHAFISAATEWKLKDK